MESSQAGAPNVNPGLIAGVMTVVKNMLGLVLNRIELAAIELSEARTNLLKLLLVSVFGIIAIWFALAYGTILLVYLTWDAMGWKILALIAAAFTLLAVGIFWYARAVVAQGKLSMPATMAELRGDHETLM